MSCPSVFPKTENFKDMKVHIQSEFQVLKFSAKNAAGVLKLRGTPNYSYHQRNHPHYIVCSKKETVKIP